MATPKLLFCQQSHLIYNNLIFRQQSHPFDNSILFWQQSLLSSLSTSISVINNSFSTEKRGKRLCDWRVRRHRRISRWRCRLLGGEGRLSRWTRPCRGEWGRRDRFYNPQPLQPGHLATPRVKRWALSVVTIDGEKIAQSVMFLVKFCHRSNCDLFRHHDL